MRRNRVIKGIRCGLNLGVSMRLWNISEILKRKLRKMKMTATLWYKIDSLKST